MNILDGIKNFLQFINANWTSICILIGLVIALVEKIKSYLNKTKEEKIEIAKKQIKETVLKLVTDAETEYSEWIKAGSIKRSQVIDKIFEKYPALSNVVDQETLVEWIDTIIDEALDTMRNVFTENSEESVEVDDVVENIVE